MRCVVLASVAVALAFGSIQIAAAADMPVKAPPMRPFSWTGCFVGGNGGGLWSRNSWSTAPGDTTPTPIGTPFGSHTASGGLAGVQVGCDYQFTNNWVVGIQGDYDWARATGSSDDFVNNTFGAGTGWRDETKVRSLGSVTARFG